MSGPRGSGLCRAGSRLFLPPAAHGGAAAARLRPARPKAGYSPAASAAAFFCPALLRLAAGTRFSLMRAALPVRPRR